MTKSLDRGELARRSQTGWSRHSVADADCTRLRRTVRLRGGLLREVADMKRFAGLRLVQAATALVTISLAVIVVAVGAGSDARAQPVKTPAPKIWRHGIIEAKSDAGILFAASRRDFAATLGLKLDFVQLKNDSIALKALLAGDLDSYEGGTGGAIIPARPGG